MTNSQQIVLVRHGEVANPHHVVYADLDGFSLSSRGVRQAEVAAERLAAAPVELVVSSPLTRATETAAAIARPHGCAVVVDERLTEWRLSSRWAGVRWEELPDRFPGELEAYLEHPHDLSFTQESIAAVAVRMRAAVADRSAQRQCVVFVSHQDPVQAARLALTGRSLSALPHGKPGHAAVITLTNTRARWSEQGLWEPPQE